MQNSQPEIQSEKTPTDMAQEAPGEMETESAELRQRRVGIALCLSGGGFRAALFHLGALRRLHELGILPQVRTISSVSGGSIIAAFLANCIVKHNPERGLAFADWESEIAAPFRAFVARDLRTFLILAHLLWNWALPGLRARHLERRYQKRLTSLKLGELPQNPRFIFCATDLTFGVNWIFTRERTGDYQAGYLRAAEWPLARAVAASSCFPPIFGPLRVRASADEFKKGNYRGANRQSLLSRLSLSDGGVYDNMGYEPVLRNHEYLLISDCGAPFQFSTSGQPLSRLLRYTSVVMNQAGTLRKRFFFAGITQKNFKGAYWGISNSSSAADAATGFTGYTRQLVGEVVAKVRTDLDAFSDAEMRVLENHGYCVADQALRLRCPEWFSEQTPPLRPPHAGWVEEVAIRAALKSSHRRFSIRRWLRR